MSLTSVVARGLAAASVFLAALTYLYRPFLAEGLVSGDVFDTRIQIAILENWSNCLAGRASCLTPNYFHPTPGTLGYNDGYLVSGLIYAAARRLGLDPYLSYEAVAITVRACGFAALIVFATTVLRLRFGFALLAALLWLVALNAYNRIGHSQLLYAGVFPLGLLLLVRLGEAMQHFDTPDAPSALRRARITALLLGLLATAWALTAYYSFFFFTLFAVLYVSIYLLRRRGEAKAMARGLISRPGLIALLAGTAALVPLALILVYGRVLRDTGGHTWFAGSAPRLYDLFNVGPDALVWSPLIAPLYTILSGRPLVLNEMSTGFPLVFLMLVAFGTIQALAVAKNPVQGDRAGAVEKHGKDVLTALALAGTIMVLLVLRVGGGYSAWQIVMKVFPGATGIRVPSRALLMVTPIACLVVAAALSTLWTRYRGRRWAAPTAALVVVVLLVEEVNIRPAFHLDRNEELAFLASLPPAPADCQSFYVSVPRFLPFGDATVDRYYIHSVDAMLIAALHRLPTVNGMATFTPKDWGLLGPFEPDYLQRVAAHAAAHGLVNVCALDLVRRQWSNDRL